jgi:hypothetical protein
VCHCTGRAHTPPGQITIPAASSKQIRADTMTHTRVVFPENDVNIDNHCFSLHSLAHTIETWFKTSHIRFIWGALNRNSRRSSLPNHVCQRAPPSTDVKVLVPLSVCNSAAVASYWFPLNPWIASSLLHAQLVVTIHWVIGLLASVLLFAVSNSAQYLRNLL